MAPSSHPLRKSLAFLIIGFVLLWSLFHLIDKGVRASDFEQTGKVNRICNHQVDPQLMIFGSSVSEVGVDPRILSQKTGLSAYNCSINGTRYMQYRCLMDEFNVYSQKPGYVVLVETYFSFEPVDALTMSEYFMANIGNDQVYHALYSIQPDLVWKSRYIPFYKYVGVTNRYYKNAALGWKRILKHLPDSDTLLGYAPVDRKWEADADEAIRLTPRFKVKVDSLIVARYIESIRAFQARGKKVVLVLTPMFTEMLSRVTDISPVREELAKIAQSTGSRLLDFSRSTLCQDRANFYNSNHLNKDGSLRFSQMLGDSLAALGARP